MLGSVAASSLHRFQWLTVSSHGVLTCFARLSMPDAMAKGIPCMFPEGVVNGL